MTMTIQFLTTIQYKQYQFFLTEMHSPQFAVLWSSSSSSSSNSSIDSTNNLKIPVLENNEKEGFDPWLTIKQYISTLKKLAIRLQ